VGLSEIKYNLPAAENDMVLNTSRNRPAPWAERTSGTSGWLIPFAATEWFFEWIAFALSRWSFLAVLEYMGTFSVLIAVIFYFSESGNRAKQRHYQAWQVINTAQGKGGSGGRIEALQELNADKVPLVGVDVSSAFLQGLRLRNADLLRADFSSADLRNSDLTGVNLTLANLNSANLRGAVLDHARFDQADLRNADLNGTSLVGVELSGAMLDGADLRHADLREAKWQGLKSVKMLNVSGIRNAPAGFIEWALKNGAVNQSDLEE
jgi:hypothetical protein